MSAEDFEGIQKAQEGTTLALEAVCDALQKSSEATSGLTQYVSKLVAKQEADEEKAKVATEEEEEELAFEKLCKALQSFGFMRKQDSIERPTMLPKIEGHGTAKTQEIIQGAVVAKQEPVEEEEEEEKPVLEKQDAPEDEEKEKEYPELEKAIIELRKENAELRKSIDTQVSTTVENVLSKMGFKKEKKTFMPNKPVQIGADETLIKKSEDASGDRVEQLAKLSYAQLRKLQLEDEAGKLPPEIKQMIS